ncbi:hypothetical protein [Streptomyces sp. Cmuel-A718b]|uniref:hypothetical protein n=1 Tax=unclassified Streptomyces TaxID=2593676 RepID=UPI000B840991|nr:hypothetical protein [Streptomyces sp. Cmuel-A718b]
MIRSAAGIPDEVQLAAKPRPATGEMTAAALEAGITASRVTGDEACGQDPHLRARPEGSSTGHVLAVARSTRVRINQGRTRCPRGHPRRPARRFWPAIAAGAAPTGPPIRTTPPAVANRSRRPPRKSAACSPSS